MSIHEYVSKGAPESAHWIGVVTDTPNSTQARLAASGLEWEVEKTIIGLEMLFLVRLPEPSSEGFLSLGPEVLHAIRDGHGAVIERPTSFLDAISLSQGKSLDEATAATFANTDARAVEGALENMPEGPVRELVRVYLESISVVQSQHGIRGNGERTLKFISHFWELGDAGVTERFLQVLPKITGRGAASGGLERSAKQRPQFEARLSALECRVRLRR